MDTEQQANPETKGPCYDVFVRVPSGAQLAVIRDKAILDGIIPVDKIEKLIQVLEKTPKVKIGHEVTRDKADKAKRDFTQAGLEVDLAPVLALEGLSKGGVDEQYACPACEKKVQLTAERQCPSCGVFVDKVSEEFLMRKRMLEQERERLELQRAKDLKASEKRNREAREAALRDEIRRELAEEYGLDAKPSALGRFAGVAKAAGVLVLLGAAFGVGQWKGGQSATVAAANVPKGPAAPDIEKSFEKLGSPSSGAPGDAADIDGGGPAPEDSLVAAAGQGHVGGKTLTVEQAVAASQALAGAVGVKTGQGAGGAGGAPGAGGSADMKAAPGSAVAGTSGGADSAAAPLPAQHKLALDIEFARALAEMGQLPRAREVVKSLRAGPAVAADKELAALVNQVDIEVRAWSVAASPEGRRRPLVDALRTDASALPDPAARTLALARVGAILGESPGLPTEVSVAFLKLARDSLTHISDVGQRNAVGGEFLVALGRTLLADSVAKASEGAWVRVRALSTDIGALVAQAPNNETAIRLMALDLRGKTVAGLGAEIPSRLGAALDLIEKEASVTARANLLRWLAAAPEVSGHEKFKAAIDRLEAAADAKLGAAKAQALTTVALMYADVGAPEKFAAYRKRVQETQGVSGTQLTMTHADLIVSGDIAAARQLHSVKAYAEAEAKIQRVAGYLL